MNQRQALRHAPAAGASLSVELGPSTKGLSLQLQSTLLPEIRNQLIKLSDLLQEPQPVLKLVKEIKSVLIEASLQLQLRCTSLTGCPNEQQYLPLEVNNQQTVTLKSTNIRVMKFRLRNLFKFLHNACTACDRCCDYTQNLMYLAGDRDARKQIDSAKLDAVNSTSAALKTLDSIVDMLKGSAIDLVQSRWLSHIGRIDNTLEELLSLYDPSTQGRHERTHPLRAPVINLAETLIPVIKLARLFFRKLLKLGLNTKWLLFEKMCSAERLAFSPLSAEPQLKELLVYLKPYLESSDAPAPLHWGDFNRIVNNLKADFGSALCYVVRYLILLNGPSDQVHLVNWLYIWDKELSLAIDKLLKAFALFRNNINRGH
ncbi:hypothetical protein PTTG_25242 [Puccinia triticina 1-1 BBBD Race 1]|uniref:Uncharacterized protein n=2 Tax=Puccinia triticina TaxID=208348 RepID=A0A180H3R8_PUCT1|nr:uncharacterized protein PtA15_2A464 [Puccinia triticina]OAV99655.1 hypothetical protein PTTG_25242 [Puccinia triticina 1-1 BBBD Race 1]WAQ82149.1 hypothetical protein PtA15_2A464 [Puccinia triticina]WAR53008.1 hypothetical protein PtB15_2B436 [Puccinia triticina]